MPGDSERRNPLLAVDAIVRMNHRIILVERKNKPTGWAIPGGFVETGETVESAVRRELREETNLDLTNLRQWRVFSDPERDPRQHVVSVVFTACGTGTPRAATDAADVASYSLHDDLPDLVFDHDRILQEYRCHRFKPTRGGVCEP